MRTWGSRVLRASSRAGMRRAAWGFSLAPAVLLIFTRVWMLREGEKQTGYRLQTKAGRLRRGWTRAAVTSESGPRTRCSRCLSPAASAASPPRFSGLQSPWTHTYGCTPAQSDTHTRSHTCFSEQLQILKCSVEKGCHLAERLQSEVCSFSHRFLRNQEIVT